jgi:hypothetical protein
MELPDYLLQGGAFGLLAYVVHHLINSVKPAIDRNTAALLELSAAIRGKGD